MVCIYRTNFKLTNVVNDFDAAKGYLIEDEMIKYFDECDKVKKIDWHLESCDSGYIEVITDAELTEEESRAVSKWISGQNSDGLGEGFEQQDFAWIPYDEDDPWGDGEMASFDWETNDYELELVFFAE